MTDNIKKNKNQHNDAIEYEPRFGNKFSLSSGNKDPLSVVTVEFIGVKKQRATTSAGLTCLWDSGAAENMIKIRHTKPYKLNIRSTKVKYSTSTGTYYMMHDIKVPFCMP